MKAAIIGGSGFSKYGTFGVQEVVEVTTPYGSVEIVRVEEPRYELYFVPRHGKGHAVPPHKVNYRAIVRALFDLGVERIISTTAVGSLNLEMLPGSIVIPDQIIDMTRCREHTFCEEGRVYHIDMTEPLCSDLRDALRRSVAAYGEDAIDGATYVVTEGPRFETPAEIRAFKVLGGDLVGMTLMPECALARELGMCYATVSVVTNLAAGIQGEHLSAREVDELMRDRLPQLSEILRQSFVIVSEEKGCSCASSLEGSEV